MLLLISLQLGRLCAFGGGDGPEEVLGGLNKAAQLDWNSYLRFLVWIGDAPPHGRGLNEGYRDDHPAGSPLGHTPQGVMSALIAKDVQLVLCPLTRLNQMLSEFKRWYNDPAAGRELKVIDLLTGGAGGAAATEHLVRQFGEQLSQLVGNHILHGFL